MTITATGVGTPTYCCSNDPSGCPDLLHLTVQNLIVNSAQLPCGCFCSNTNVVVPLTKQFDRPFPYWTGPAVTIGNAPTCSGCAGTTLEFLLCPCMRYFNAGYFNDGNPRGMWDLRITYTCGAFQQTLHLNCVNGSSCFGVTPCSTVGTPGTGLQSCLSYVDCGGGTVKGYFDYGFGAAPFSFFAVITA